ncbi:MAG: T9SS sorting signal type C domain-containing protein [Flavobacterium nitrogenifigens]|uniref:T9SS sorting signal type C domain-containing protein n=1 Tax=Flavobacterium nitrogenifigens TaxID=1617283 RepID=UPI002808278C|nr:T9SS sorting signal type C domain-containing protein [Flavobacterium nitrogenifigens]MDQ8011046.1 T9SS sorting signal type C domain-containing protein [Flavobacterium nitrogenifigens]
MMRKLLYSFLFFISSKSFSKRSFTPSLGLLCVGMFFVSNIISGQTWTGSISSDWSTAGNWSGNAVPGNNGDVIIPTVTSPNFYPIVATNSRCRTIMFTGNSPSLTVNGGVTLTVTGAVTVQSSNSSPRSTTITGGGTITSGSFIVGTSSTPNSNSAPTSIISTISNFNISGDLTILSSVNGVNTNNATFNLEGGSLNINGQIKTTAPSSTTSLFTMAIGTQSRILLLGNATPFAPTGAGTSTFTLNGSGSTVNYYNTGSQTIRATSYNNLVLSGSGTKTFGSTPINITNNLSIDWGVVANLSNSVTHIAKSLTLGGHGQNSGYWGGRNGNSVNYKSEYYFGTSATGRINVGDSCNDVAVTISTLSTLICKGASVTFTATPTYAISPSYQWKVNGANVGTNNATFTSTTLSNNDKVTCVVTSGVAPCLPSGSTATSNEITMFVSAITASASPTTVASGGTVNLTSSVVPASYMETLLTQDFNTSGWAASGTSGTVAWTLKPDGYFYEYTNSGNFEPFTFRSNDNTQFYLSNSATQDASIITYLTSPVIPVTGCTSLSLEFYHYYYSWSGDSAAIEVSANGGTSWTPVQTFNTTQGTENKFEKVTIPLNAFANGTNTTIIVRFKYTASFDWFWAIDNVKVTGTKPVTYTYNWTAIPSGTTAGLSSTNIANPTATPTQTTSYMATATNTVSNCTVSSSPVLVTVTPVINSFTPTSACAGSGTSVVISGSAFNGATAVTFNGVASTFTVDSNTQITATLPSTAATGTISVTTPSGSVTSASSFTVNPTSIGGTLSGSIVGCTASNGTTFTLTGNVGNVVQWESSTDNFNTPGIIIANTMTNLSVSNVSVTTYYRAVVKSGGCSIAYSSIGSIITGKVTATAATLPVCNGFTANWNKVPGATTYLLDVSTSNTFSPFVPGFNGKDVGDISSFTVTNLLPNVTYYYRIHPIYSCGVYAVASNVISVTTAALPTVAAIGGGANSVCIGASTPAFTNSTSGGTWSITNVTGDASITTGGVVTGVASGTVTVGYTITNGSCSNTVTKSLIINPTNTVSLTSAIGTNAQTVCENTAITNISYATTGATGATVTGLPAGVIGDWSGNVVTISGTPTASSGSPFNYTVTLNGGCGNVFATGTITVNPAPTTPSITKNNDASCSSLGSITITGLSGNWTINQTGDMGARPFNGTSSNFSIQDLTAGTHYFTVTNSTTGCTSGIATVKINDTTVDTEWDGSGWTNGVPDGNKRVTISSIGSVQPFSALAQTNIDACSLIITAGSDVIIPSGVTLTVTNAINSNGKLVFESGSSLLQGKDAVNIGDIVYKRAVSLSRYDVVYWSMPVTKAGFTMHDFSPNTLYDKYFYWDELNGKWVYDINGKEPMRVGEGYNIRAPQDHSITSPSIFTGVFTGVPNNGDINVAVEPNKWNFLGNPYPSAVDASDLILDTNKDVLGALYFWTHSQAPQIISGTNTYRYISSDYIVYNGVGSIRVNNPSGPTNEFKGNIAAGQGFFAMPTVSQIKFNNDLRRGSSENTQFYKTAKTKKIEKNRLWLNATNSQGAFKQMLIGYMEGATNDIDISYDAITMGSNSYVDLYSINNTKRLTIQGRALPFDNTEVIPLGFKCGVDATGDRNFTISIDHADGFFATQEVYLEDKALGIITDLRKENYTFTSGTGTYSNRFALRYTNKALGNDDFENLENNVLVSVKDKIINVISSKETIKEISVYNIGAELLYSNTKVNASELQIKNLHSSDQVLLVNITLENGHAFTKKIIFSNL